MFAVPDPGLTEQSSWEAHLGALGRCVRIGGGRMEMAVAAVWGPALWQSWSGEPLMGGWRVLPGQPCELLEPGNRD